MHHEHNHHTTNESISKKDAKKLLGIAAINAALFGFSLTMANITNVAAFKSEGSHDLSDTTINATRALSAFTNTYEKTWYAHVRKFSYTMICGFGVYAAYKSGIDLLSAPFRLSKFSEQVPEIIGASGIAAGNQAAYILSETLESEALLTKDAKKHNKNDRNVSVVLAAAVAVGAALPYVAETAGVVMGGYTAWHMRPTEQNMSHQH